jgi:hypothetical protein
MHLEGPPDTSPGDMAISVGESRHRRARISRQSHRLEERPASEGGPYKTRSFLENSFRSGAAVYEKPKSRQRCRRYTSVERQNVGPAF